MYKIALACKLSFIIEGFLLFSEQSVCQARASVMLYNNDIKKWEHAGGTQGISQVQVYHNHANNNYRIVGIKSDTNEVRFGSFSSIDLYLQIQAQ